MKSDFSKAVQKLNEAAAPASGEPMRPCIVCGTPTQVVTLSTYGARCLRCYRDFCDAAFYPDELFYFGDAAYRDTPTQRDMRTRIRGRIGNLRLPATNIERKAAMQTVSDDVEARLLQAKRDTQARVDAYKRERGL